VTNGPLEPVFSPPLQDADRAGSNGISLSLSMLSVLMITDCRPYHDAYGKINCGASISRLLSVFVWLPTSPLIGAYLRLAYRSSARSITSHHRDPVPRGELAKKSQRPLVPPGNSPIQPAVSSVLRTLILVRHNVTYSLLRAFRLRRATISNSPYTRWFFRYCILVLETLWWDPITCNLNHSVVARP
jgi:hypothetical protein